MLALLVMTALAPVEYTGDKAKEIKVYAKQPGGVYRKTLVMRTATELNLATPIGGKDYDIVQITADMLKVKSIDLKKQMVIVIYDGAKPTPGYSIVLKSLEVKENKLIVHWKVKAPGPDEVLAQVITHPELVLLVDRFDGEVVFDPAPSKK